MKQNSTITLQMRNINKMDIRINSYIPVTDVEGIGTRFAIWVQGCSIRCKGCANFHMWDANGGTSYNVGEFIELIKSYKSKIEGITWLGGEPTEQIEAVTEISKAVQKIGLSVILFTGYEYSVLKENSDFQELVKYIDILIDGKFEQDKIDYSRPWVGSSNQNYHFLSSRYDEDIIAKYKNKIEVRVTPDNRILITGMGNFNDLVKLVG